jgi:DNA anti-recombination protein RmuC
MDSGHPMALAEEEIQFIKEHLGLWLAEQSIGKPPAVYEIELRERMLRVEEELKNQRELIKTILEQMDKRFDAVDKRFDAVDKRFESMQQTMDKRFESMQQTMDKRFEASDKRFEALGRRLDRFMFWSFSLTVSVGALVVGAIKLWP